MEQKWRCIKCMNIHPKVSFNEQTIDRSRKPFRVFVHCPVCNKREMVEPVRSEE